MTHAAYDALLVFSFGGPEGPEDVMPFLANVVRGRDVPRARLLEVAEHYLAAGGISPINQHNRDLIKALADVIEVPIYWGNRNWHPYGRDVVAQMKADGVRRAAVFVTSAFGGYSSCRQYYEDLAAIAVPGGPELIKLPHYGDHPGFIEAMADHTAQALAQLPTSLRDRARLVFTAHSVPTRMAAAAGPVGWLYERQLQISAQLVAEQLGHPADAWDLVWQSRSGPAHVPWLEPDVCDHLATLDAPAVVLVPIGFVSDHMEVIHDLDIEARQVCQQRGLPMARAATVGTHPQFLAMVADLLSQSEPNTCAPSCCALRPTTTTTTTTTTPTDTAAGPAPTGGTR